MCRGLYAFLSLLAACCNPLILSAHASTEADSAPVQDIASPTIGSDPASGAAPLAAQTEAPAPLAAQTEAPAPRAAQTESPEPLAAQTEAPAPRPSGLIEIDQLVRQADRTSGSPRTLVDVYLLARRNDPRYKAARLEFEAVALGVKEARSGFLPVIAFDLGLGRINQDILRSSNTVFGSGESTYGSRDQTFSLTQPIFRVAAWRKYDQATAAERQAAATYAAAEQDLIQRTVTAYLNVLAGRDMVEFARAERQAIAAQLELADQRFKSGQATQVTLLDAQARHALKEADVLNSQNTLNDRIQAVREITGVPVETFTPLAEAPLTPPDPMNMEEWVKAAVERNLLIEARIQGVEVARWEVERQRAAHFPTVDLLLRSNRQTTGGSLFGGGSDVRNNEAFFRLHVPLFNGGSFAALTQQAQKRYEASQEDLERDRRSIARQARAAYEGVTSGIVRVHALEQTREALQGARELRSEGFKAGLTTMLAVLDAERDLYAVRRDAAQARYDYLLNMVRLKQAAGTLGEDDIERMSRMMR